MCTEERQFNNGWNTLYNEALNGRAVYAAKKKRLVAEKTAALKAGDKKNSGD